ncbi:uncharacterized protein EAF01_006369 [Botrytis porri]|uniref:uncharacterized protein n=1 Tax=Botrytis porri TaxID=87229 RepID=UPI0018FF260D|nr:uncharacterized protein EAF01_006369 [Botrytis porri]KAF7903320.1 hypothetical protein EAF01_006369 [Botrytis porri]
MSKIAAPPIGNASTPVPVLKTQPRLKGKARKLAKECKERQQVQESVPVLKTPSKKYTITTIEILKQAKFVTEKIELPQTVRKVLQRAIHARKRCADWFESSKFGNQSSNNGHQHFIELLQDILSALDQGENDRSHSNSMNVSCKTSRNSQDTESSWTENFNRFQNLEIEDCFEEDSEVENDQESSEPNVDTPDTSDTFHRSEQEILRNAPKLFSKARSYDTIAAVIFYANGSNTEKDPTQKMEPKELLRPTPFDDFIYLSTARILMKHDNICKMGAGYPILLLPLRAAYISCPELLRTPYMDKKEKEDALLSQLIIDLDLFDIYNRLTKEDVVRGPALYAPPAADALTAGLSKLKVEGHISVTVVFASQIFLDLNEILGDDITEGRKDWERLASKSQSSLDSCLYLPKDTASGYCWNPNDLHTLKKILEINSRYTDSTMFKKLKDCFVDENCPGPDWGKVIYNESTSTTSLVNRLDQYSSSTSVLQPMASKKTHCTEKGNLPGVQFSKDPVLTNTYTRFPVRAILSDGRLARDWSKKRLIRIGAVTKVGNTETHNQQLIKRFRQLDIRLIRPHSDSLFFYTHNPVYCGMIALRLTTSYDDAGLCPC